ncbi:hypothetical protein ACRE_055960 [Hapsidospora chrysogenum ATCC 11550]|uniref:Uncharacterized protein n=1 Tax=Hapsidospora chrysogenum (strain ATCC 11550 / CBS 779.69 / DSM 880 / IAM 14645 / JCM 23072 / IMI 49137) TaxID=857340 RepID=A0A086T2T3_HAPC1|nr:hypothetical protein ACRE_055960 [Hapsidospora chrysogenum ATCC 11550]
MAPIISIPTLNTTFSAGAIDPGEYNNVTPDEASDNNRTVGIVIGVIAAVAIVGVPIASCIYLTHDKREERREEERRKAERNVEMVGGMAQHHWRGRAGNESGARRMRDGLVVRTGRGVVAVLDWVSGIAGRFRR